MLKATQFIRNPFVITGVEVTLGDMEEIARWCEGQVLNLDTSRPFIRVPVDRATHRRQTEAYVGMWITVSIHRGARSFKVYPAEWLERDFSKLPDLESLGLPTADIPESKPTPVSMNTTFVAPAVA